MDEEIVILGADGTEHVFPAGFDPKRAAEIVRGQSAASQPESPKAPLGVAAAFGAAKAAPAIVSGVNKAAGVVGGLASKRAAKLVPAVVAGTAINQASQGDLGGAAKTVGTAAAVSQIPRAARAVQSATNPAVQRMVRFAGELLPVSRTPAGFLARGAGALSTVANALSLPVTAISFLNDEYQRLEREIDDPNTPPERRKLYEQVLERMTDTSLGAIGK